MKINTKNPLHWIYLLWAGLLCFFLLPIRIFASRNSRKSIILYGHKLHGNLNALYTHARRQENLSTHEKIYFLTLDPQYYREIEHQQNILLALNPVDLSKVVFADCIISDHGLHSLILLFKLSNIHFIDVWHGIPFKGFVPDDFTVQRQYEEVWVSSQRIRQLYRETFGFDASRVFATGYGRTDLILNYQDAAQDCKAQIGLPSDKKIILFAPTWKQDSANRNEIPFGLSTEEFISALHEFARMQDACIIVRFHLNTTLGSAFDSEHMVHLPLSQFPDTEMIIGVSDVLITDWSSIAFDMMVTDNPIVFLDVPPPFKHGLSLPADFRAGDIVGSLPELLASLEQACYDKESYTAKHRTAYERVKKAVYDDTLDGHSTDRYMERLTTLLHGEASS